MNPLLPKESRKEPRKKQLTSASSATNDAGPRSTGKAGSGGSSGVASAAGAKSMVISAGNEHQRPEGRKEGEKREKLANQKRTKYLDLCSVPKPRPGPKTGPIPQDRSFEVSPATLARSARSGCF